MTALAALVLAHLLGDFVLQSSRQVAMKRDLRLRARAWHAGGIAALTLVLVWAASGQPYIGLTLSLGVLHGAQDLAKDALRRRWPIGHGWAWITLDQILHLGVMSALVAVFGLVQVPVTVSVWVRPLHQPGIYLAATLAVTGTFVAGVMLQELLAPLLPRPHRIFSPGDDMHAAVRRRLRPPDRPTHRPSPKASFAVVLNRRSRAHHRDRLRGCCGRQGLATAELVVAAKSIFRWRDFAPDAQGVQYYLLGTLASVAVAVVAGLLMRRIVT